MMMMMMELMTKMIKNEDEYGDEEEDEDLY